MKKRYMYSAFKYGIYALLILFSYILSTLPGLPSRHPILVIPAVVAISLYEQEFIGGLYGAWGGLLLDYGAQTIFGLYAMLMLVLGCASGLLALYLFRNSMKSAVIQTAAVAFIHALAGYFFLYGMWRLPGSGILLLTQFLPSVILTVLFSPLYHYAIGFIHNRFEPFCKPVEEL